MKAAQQEWTLCSPIADFQLEELQSAERLSNMEGKKIGLFWNGKPNGDVLLKTIEDELTSRFSGLNVIRMWDVRPETQTQYGNTADNLKFMAECSDFVIGASAD